MRYLSNGCMYYLIVYNTTESIPTKKEYHQLKVNVWPTYVMLKQFIGRFVYHLCSIHVEVKVNLINTRNNAVRNARIHLMTIYNSSSQINLWAVQSNLFKRRIHRGDNPYKWTRWRGGNYRVFRLYGLQFERKTEIYNLFHTYACILVNNTTAIISRIRNWTGLCDLHTLC